VRSKKRLSEPFHALLPTIYCGTPEQALLELKRNAKGKKCGISDDNLAPERWLREQCFFRIISQIFKNENLKSWITLKSKLFWKVASLGF